MSSSTADRLVVKMPPQRTFAPAAVGAGAPGATVAGVAVATVVKAKADAWVARFGSGDVVTAHKRVLALPEFSQPLTVAADTVRRQRKTVATLKTMVELLIRSTNRFVNDQVARHFMDDRAITRGAYAARVETFLHASDRDNWTPDMHAFGVGCVAPAFERIVAAVKGLA